MSGAEVLSGIGILCNAMQIVTFGKDALEVYSHVRENGTADPRLETFLADASISYQEMRKQLSVSGPLTFDQQEIVRIAEGAHNGLEKFRTCFAQLYVDEDSRKGIRGRLRVARSGFKTLFRAKELEDLEKNLKRYEQLFQTRLIQRVCSQGDAIALLTQEYFTDLNIAQQSMVKNIAEGHTKTSLLVSQKAVEIKDHVTNQHGETRTTMENYLSLAENNLRSHITESTSLVQRDMTSRHNTEDDMKRYDQLIASLRYPEMNSRKNQVVENFPETFQWIFSNKGPWAEDTSSLESYSSETDTTDMAWHNSTTATTSSSDNSTEFTRWLGSESKMFWICGKPGSGKSTLMKFIATNSVTKEYLTAWRSGVHILTHYFWKAGNPMERSLKGLLLSITHQILLDRIALAQQLWWAMPELHHKWSHGDWDMQQLEATLLWVLEAVGENFFLIIDGLDESEELGAHLYTTPSNQNIFHKLAKEPNVKTCVSSREEYIFNNHFEGIETLQIHKLTEFDIRKFADHYLEATNFANPGDREDILNLVAKKADGVFLWVVLVLNSVNRAFRIDYERERLIERIEHMPRDLVNLFRDMWERSGDDGDVPSYRACASRYFNLALAFKHNPGNISILHMTLASEDCSLESIINSGGTWDLVEVAMMCSRTEKKLSLVCHGLLEVVVETYLGLHPLPTPIQHYGEMKVKFAHRCVIDFLRDTEDGSTLLNACGWRQGEALARSMGVGMALECLICPVTDTQHHLLFYDQVHGKKRYLYQTEYHSYVEEILDSITTRAILGPYRGILLRNLYEWYAADFLYDRSSWRSSGHFVFLGNSWKDQFVASMTKAADLSIMERLIVALPREEFLNALPAIFRGLSAPSLKSASLQYSHQFDEGEVTYELKRSRLTKLILSRLLGLQEEGSSGDIPQDSFSGEAREDLRRLVCSWFLASLDTSHYQQRYHQRYQQRYGAVQKTDLAVLELIKLALPSLDDWNQPVLLCLRCHRGFARGFMYCTTRKFSDDFYVVVNLATVYQIFLRSLQRGAAASHTTQRMPSMNEQIPDMPNGAELSLRIVLIADGTNYYRIYSKNQSKGSELLLGSLLTGRLLTEEEVASVKQRKGWPVCGGNMNLLSYLISELSHIPGLPMHPWSVWRVRDVSGHNQDEDCHDQVDLRSQDSFRKVIEQISQDL